MFHDVKDMNYISNFHALIILFVGVGIPAWLIATIVVIFFLLLLFVFTALISKYFFKKNWLPHLLLTKVNKIHENICRHRTSTKHDEKFTKIEDVEIGKYDN